MRKALLAAATSVVAVLLVATSALSASPKSKSTASPQLRGTWVTTVSLSSPPPGVDPTFQALDTFVGGGGILVTSSQSHPTTRSLAHGDCTYSGGLQYACTFIWFRFDASGAPIGTQRVRRTMTLSADHESFDAVDVIDVLAPDGTVVASLHGTETGHKLAA